MEYQDAYFVEIVAGKEVDIKDTNFYNLLRTGDNRWNIDISPIANKIVLYRAIVNQTFGKSGEITKLYNHIKETGINIAHTEVFEVLGYRVKLKAIRYSNNLHQLHVYTYINNIEDVFLRFYILEGHLYWLLNLRKWIKHNKLMEYAVPTDALVERLKRCEKGGDAGRFVDDPKVKRNDVLYGHHYIVLKGGLIIRHQAVYNDALEKYADKHKASIYYTGDISVDDLMAVNGNITVGMLLAIKPVYKYIEVGDG
jgi:hypothetical protein